MQQDIKTFVERIFSINPTISTVYGSALAVGSRDMAGGGISNSASDTVLKLRKETAGLVEILERDSNDNEAIEAKAKVIEGHLMTLQTIGQISERLCNELISQLFDIVKE